jgi:NADH:ubiquinone oxidoreductase subunit D
VIREDRLLLAELGRLNTDVVPLAMRIMDDSATAEEHYAFAQRLTAMAARLEARGKQVGVVIDGEVMIITDQNVLAGAGALDRRGL